MGKIAIAFLSLLFVIGCPVTTTPPVTENASFDVSSKYLNNGTIRLTWNRQADAAEYVIYKQWDSGTDTESVFTKVDTMAVDSAAPMSTDQNLYYDDVISTSNPMEISRKYSYKVVAARTPLVGDAATDSTDYEKYVEKVKDTTVGETSVELSSEALIPAMGTILAAPVVTLTNVGDIGDNVYLEWTSVPYAQSYSIQSTRGNKVYTDSYLKDVTFGATTSAYTQKAKINNPGAGVWTIRVMPKAINSSDWFVVNTSSYSTTEITVPAKVATPTSVQAGSNLSTGIEITFPKVVLDANGIKLATDATYEIWRREKGNLVETDPPFNHIPNKNYTKITAVASEVTNSNNTNNIPTMRATDVPPLADVTYSYIVVAVSGTDKSVASAEDDGMMVSVVSKVKAPTNVSATTNSTENVTITFDKVTTFMNTEKLTTDATYELWRQKLSEVTTTVTGDWEKLALTAVLKPTTITTATQQLEFVDTTTVVKIQYYYKVVAVSGTNRSADSTVVTGKKIEAAVLTYSIKAPADGNSYNPSTGDYPYAGSIKFWFNKVVYDFDNLVSTVYVDATSYDIYRSDDNGLTYKLIAENATLTSNS